MVVRDIEIVVETKTLRVENNPDAAETHRPSGDGVDVLGRRLPEKRPPNVRFEHFHRVNEKVGVPQKLFCVFWPKRLAKYSQIELRVGVARYFGHHLDLGSINGGLQRSILPVDIGDRKLLGIGDRKAAHAQANESHQVDAADSAHSRYRHATIAQALLLVGRY